MGKDRKEDSFIRKVKDKGIAREKRKLASASKVFLESHKDDTTKHQQKINITSKEIHPKDGDKRPRPSGSSMSQASTSEEAMEWECTDIKVINTIQEIRKEHYSRSKCDIEEFFTSKVPKISSCACVCVVIDTNIFLSYLEIVKVLVENPQFSTKVQICIPWMVLQELDLMKTKKDNKGKIEILARNAAAFILEQSSQKAMFRLQTLDEFRECISLTDEENADDKILQWCIKLKKEDNRNICLLSNDTIFCTKATACEILSFQSRQAIEVLSSLLKTQEMQLDSHTIENRPDAEPTPKNPQNKAMTKYPTQRNACAINVRDYFEEFATPVLSEVVELEMKKVYEDLWINIVKIKPPWNFFEALQCFEKHWIAVFSYKYSKDFKLKLEQLTSSWKKVIKPSYSEANKLEDVETLIQTAICILQFIKKVNKETSAAVERSIVKLKALQVKQPVQDSASVLNLFTCIWDHINFLCGTLADVTGIPHNIVYTPGAGVASFSEIEEGLRMLAPLLANLENAMIRFIEANDKNSSSLKQSSWELSNCLAQAINLLPVKINSPVVSDNLDDSLIQFITEAEHKQLFVNGIEQLRGYSRVLETASLKIHATQGVS